MVNEFYFGFAFPLIILALWLAVYRYDWLWYLVIFATPLSINLTLFGAFSFYFPTEPILFGLMGIVLLRAATENNIDSRITSHPISRVIYLYLGWILISSFTSSMTMVSYKFFLVKLWFVVAVYILSIVIFKNSKNIYRFLGLYIAGLTIVILHTIFQHSLNGFSEESGHWVMSPFFKDHTIYGAILAMFYPVVIGFLFLKRLSIEMKTLIFGLIVLFSIAIVLSYTRAAWVSLIAASMVLMVVLLKINYRTVISIAGVFVLFFFMYQDQIIYQLEKNNQDSSNNLTEHVESMSNISTDASNLERLNRWNSALRMFRERPVFGWGPGTYQFQYAAFQKASDRTIITTRTGDQGNAHSEYLGPLSEQGLPGMVIFIVLLISVTIFALRLYGRLHDSDLKVLVLSVYLGLLTYFVHGVLNNYLDTDKASIPFWGFIAIFVAIEIYHSKGLNATTDSLVEA